MKRKTTLLHRGYLYAQKKIVRNTPPAEAPISEERMRHATTWRAGYIAAILDARRAKNR